MGSSKILIDASAPPVAAQNVTNGAKDVFADILEWSKDRPGWQRDALRRLLTAGGVLPTDIQELTELCKSAHGLGEPRTPFLPWRRRYWSHVFDAIGLGLLYQQKVACQKKLVR